VGSQELKRSKKIPPQNLLVVVDLKIFVEVDSIYSKSVIF